MTRTSSIYGKTDPRDAPAYTMAEAAHYLGIPGTTVRSWCLGQRYGEGRGKFFRPVIQPADSDARLLSFKNLVEIHILGALRRKHRIRLEHVREALKILRKQLGDEHPLLSPSLVVDDRRNLLVEVFGRLINVSQQGQTEMKQVVDEYLSRIDRDPKGVPIRLFPVISPSGGRAPIAIEPRIQFGRPCIVHTGVPTDVLAERFAGGESISSIAQDYGLKGEDVEEVLRFEAIRRAA